MARQTLKFRNEVTVFPAKPTDEDIVRSPTAFELTAWKDALSKTAREHGIQLVETAQISGEPNMRQATFDTGAKTFTPARLAHIFDEITVPVSQRKGVEPGRSILGLPAIVKIGDLRCG